MVEDYNHHPPGLHYQTIVIQTASRELRITAPSKARHRVWTLALEYLVNSRGGVGMSASNASIPLELGGIERSAADEFGTISTRGTGTPRGSLRRIDTLFAPSPAAGRMNSGRSLRHYGSGRLRHSMAAAETPREAHRTPRMSVPPAAESPAPSIRALQPEPEQAQTPLPSADDELSPAATDLHLSLIHI